MNATTFVLTALIAVAGELLMVLIFGKPEMKGKEIIRNARQNGCTATGVLVESRFKPAQIRHAGEDYQRYLHEDTYDTVYVYQVNGRDYEHRRTFYSEPPEQLELYYQPGRPQKAIANAGDWVGGRFFGIYYGIPLLIAAVVYFLFMRG